MNFDEVISTLAFSLSFFQMFSRIENVDYMNVEHKKMVLLGLLTSCLWFIYQYRQFNMNTTTFATGLGILVQLYVLNRILVKEQNSIKETVSK